MIAPVGTTPSITPMACPNLTRRDDLEMEVGVGVGKNDQQVEPPRRIGTDQLQVVVG